MSQLDDTNEPNKQFDCVPTCIAASLQWLTGKSFDAAVIKDTVYGKSYVGGTAGSEYAAYCARQGVALTPINGIPGDLVAKIHPHLEAQHPCLVTIPDPWAPSSRGWTHVLVAFGDEEPGTITMLDPYPGKPYTKSDKEWTELLLNNQIWVLEKLEKEDDMLSIDLNVPEVSAHFKQQNATSWVCLQTGKAIHDAMLTFYRTFGRNDCCGLTFLGLPVSNEISLGNGVTKQFFERGVLVYDPQRKIDNPTKSSGSVYLAHLYDGGPGTDPALVDLQKQLKDAQNATQNSASLDTVKKIKALVAPF